MSPQSQDLWAQLQADTVRFPAFVHLPASARPNITRTLGAGDTDLIKCVMLSARCIPLSTRMPPPAGPSNPTTFRKQIAQRWLISECSISAITVNLGDQRVLIENDQDWQDWVATILHSISTDPSRLYSNQPNQDQFKKMFRIPPVHINVLLDAPVPASATGAERATPSPPPAYPDVTHGIRVLQQTAGVVDPSIQMLADGINRIAFYLRLYDQRIESDAPTPNQQHASQPHIHASVPQPRGSEQQASPTAYPVHSALTQPPSTCAYANDLVRSFLEAIQPLSGEIAPVISSLLSILHITPPLDLDSFCPAVPPLSSASVGPSEHETQDAPSGRPGIAVNVKEPAPSARFVETPQNSTSTTRATAAPLGSRESDSEIPPQRQSLIEGMFDELSRLRGQQPSVSVALESPQAIEYDPSIRQLGEDITTGLGRAFAEMLAEQRAAATTAASTDTSAAAATQVSAETEEGESLTIVSRPSTSSQSSSRSRSRSPRRTTFLSSTTLSLLTLFTFVLAFINPTFASPSSLNPIPFTLNPRDGLVVPRQNSRHLHLCKCTCFQTNSTLVPLYSPVDPAKPCTTCTRQFCLDQGLAMCKGAKLEHTDHDVGTGFEGDVWAKCFERDSFKDQSIITLYLLVVVGLVAFAALRGRLEGWVVRYQQLGPQGLYNAVRESPWRRS